MTAEHKPIIWSFLTPSRTIDFTFILPMTPVEVTTMKSRHVRPLMIALAAVASTSAGSTKTTACEPAERQAAIRPPSLSGERGAIEAVAFAPDGKTLAVANGEGIIRFYDPATALERSPVLNLRARPGDTVQVLTYSPDGATLAVGLYTEGARLIDVGTRATRRTLLVPPAVRPLGPRGVQSLTALAYSPDGNALAGATSDGQVAVWDAADGTLRRVMVGPVIPPRRAGADGKFGPGRPAWLSGLAYSPDGRSLATMGHEKVIRVWDPKTGREKFTVPGAYAVYSPDGTTLAVASYGAGGSVGLLDVATGRARSVLEGSKFGPLTFLAGGKVIVCFATHELELQLWDAATGRLRHALPLGQRSVLVRDVLVTSPDGKTIAIAGSAAYGLLGWVDLFETDGNHLRVWTPRR